MKSELNHHYIGNSYGGNQDWFRTYWMRLGGCGAETACESSIYFAREFGMTELYPFDCKEINRKEYVDFAHIMEPYLSPRLTGINKLSIYVDGYSRYLRDAMTRFFPFIKNGGFSALCEKTAHHTYCIIGLNNLLGNIDMMNMPVMHGIIFRNYAQYFHGVTRIFYSPCASNAIFFISSLFSTNVAFISSNVL